LPFKISSSPNDKQLLARFSSGLLALIGIAHGRMTGHPVTLNFGKRPEYAAGAK
jgi:hypothetical protein